MRAGNHNLLIEQGSNFNVTLQLKESANGDPIDLSSYTLARGQIRKKVTGPVLASFTCAISDSANGKVTISLTSSQTTALNFGPGRLEAAMYDIELVDTTGEVERILYGNAVLSKEITR